MNYKIILRIENNSNHSEEKILTYNNFLIQIGKTSSFIHQIITQQWNDKTSFILL